MRVLLQIDLVWRQFGSCSQLEDYYLQIKVNQMTSINSTIKHIKASLQIAYNGDHTPKAKVYAIKDIIVNGAKLPGFKYNKLSQQKQNNHKQIQHRQQKTQNKHIISPVLFRNEIIKGFLKNQPKKIDKDSKQAEKQPKRPIVKEKIVIEGEKLHSLSLLIKRPQRANCRSLKTCAYFGHSQNIQQTSNHIDREVRRHSQRKQAQVQRLRTSNSFLYMSQSSETKEEGINSLIISQRNNPLNLRLISTRRVVKHSRSFDEQLYHSLQGSVKTSKQASTERSSIKICFSNRPQNGIQLSKRDFQTLPSPYPQDTMREVEEIDLGFQDSL